MNESHLLSLGFKRLGDYKLKRNRPNFLVWDCLFAPGESITIELTFNESIWQVSKVCTEGKEASKKVAENLEEHTLQNVITFIQEFPRTTNP